MQTEFDFTLPKGYLDDDGTLYRHGVMRLSRAMDEIVPLRDPRVKSNSAYATVMILSRVIIKLGSLEEVTPRVVENFFTRDLDYLQKFYRQINELTFAPETVIDSTPTGNSEFSSAIPSPLEDTSPDRQSSHIPISTDDYIRAEAGDGPPIMPPSPRARAAAQQP